MKQWRWIQETRNKMEPRTLVEILGTGRVLVEYHRGVMRFGQEEILVRGNHCLVRIQGDGLRLCCMSREQLFITGKIKGVELEEG